MASSSPSFWNIAYRQAMKSGVLVAKVYCFLHVTTTHLLFPAYAFGPSMIPTLHPSGNVVLAERISTRWARKLNRGDVVVLQSPEDPNKTPIKRVVGLEGDCVSFVVDPDKTDESKPSWFLKGMSGCKVTILTTLETRESLVLYLMVLFKAECFGGQIISDSYLSL